MSMRPMPEDRFRELSAEIPEYAGADLPAIRAKMREAQAKLDAGELVTVPLSKVAAMAATVTLSEALDVANPPRQP